jgi:hypothetical protein
VKRVASVAACLALLALGWLLQRSEGAPDAVSEAPPPRPGTVSIDDTGRERIDLATAALEPARSEGALDVQARVLDPIPLVDAVLARAAARATSEPARREVERVRALSRDAQNASQRDLEAAEAAWRKAQLEQGAAQARLIASFSVELAERPDLEALVASLASRRTALARVELPAGVAAPGPPAGLQLRSVTGTKREGEGALVGEAPTTDPQLQGLAWLALIEHEPPPPGTALAGRLALPDLTRTGLRVPEDAVVRQDGGAFVYVEISHDVFERRSVTLERALPGAWLGTGSIAAGDAVVVRGAQELLSAERGVAHAGD